ncbi:MAG: YidC/Oxa1 family membrane protein insertase [Firmicutes bacterium]|nr:YidC/Oxa1 family membrane protein insertase [Bacillota bacterium]
MRFFDIVITDQIMWLVDLCYRLIPNYIIAIILFTFITRLLIFPFSLWAQRQSVKLAKIKPQLDDIKAYYGHDWRLVLREQRKLYKKEKYSTIVSILPLILQMPIIIGVLRGIGSSDYLSELPSNALLPILSALSAFALCYVQNFYNVLAKSMNFFAKWGFAIFMTAFSLYFTITSGIGFGIYWTAGNIFAILIQVICNLIYNPKKYITYEICPPVKKDKELIKRQKAQQKIDVEKFMKAKKYLVFYSEASGFYKYYKGIIGHVLDNSKIHVHYLTSDINDQVFKIDHPRLHVYYCGPRKLITVLMRLDCRVCVMTMPDLHKYQYKRSIVNKKIEYVYIDHGFGSQTYVLRKNALDHFDTVFCYGPNYNEEFRAMENFYGSKEKKLVNVGFGLFHEMEKNYKPKKENKEKTIIIAPSWQKDNIFESCIDEIMKELVDTKYKVILRPHPEFIKRFPRKIELLKKKYENELQLDFSCDILNADIIITDWSSIGLELAWAANKPTLFINTPEKVLNPDWDKYGDLIPLELSLRDKIGVSVNMDEINTINEKIEQLKEIKNARAVLEAITYDTTTAGKDGGEYLIKAVKEWK